METCTVVTGIAGGEFVRCGQEAVVKFTGTAGEAFAECERHKAGGGRLVVKVGATIMVEGYRTGELLAGKVVKVGRKLAYVEVIARTTGKRHVRRYELAALRV